MRARALLLGAVISLGASGCIIGSRSSSDTPAPKPLTQLRSQCGDQTGPVYKLGGTFGALLGNSKQVEILVSVGDRFAVWASFSKSQLVDFTITPPTLRVLCHVYTTGEGGGPASIFDARTVGHFMIQTDDGSNSCRGCLVLGFVAEVPSFDTRQRRSPEFTDTASYHRDRGPVRCGSSRRTRWAS